MDEKQLQALIGALDAPKWTEIATFYLLLVSILVALLSAFYAIKQLKSDHDRSKRNLSVELCTKWSEFLTIEVRSAVSLIENFNLEQTQALASFDKIIFRSRHKEDVVASLLKAYPNIEKELENVPPDGEFHLELKYVKYLHYAGLKYCNILESILLAWSSSIADRDLIYKEFQYIYDSRESRTALANFRKRVGEEYYPAIAEFQIYIDEQKKKLSNTHRTPII